MIHSTQNASELQIRQQLLFIVYTGHSVHVVLGCLPMLVGSF